MSDLWPSPGIQVVDGNRVAVEINLRMDGSTSHGADFFTLARV